MEMHQVRYVIAAAKHLNFTRAAEDCCVSQPSITRAIRELEYELGGALFRREYRHTHLTELGVRILPYLQKCYENVLSAKDIAISFKRGVGTTLSIGLTDSINSSLLLPSLGGMGRADDDLQIQLLRGDRETMMNCLKQGEVEFAIAGDLTLHWYRLNVFPLFTDHYALAMNREHPLARRSIIEPAELNGLRLALPSDSDVAGAFLGFLGEHHVKPGSICKVPSESELVPLLEANLAMGVLSAHSCQSSSIKRVRVKGFAASRIVSLYSVAGREMSRAASLFWTRMTKTDWSSHGQIADEAADLPIPGVGLLSSQARGRRQVNGSVPGTVTLTCSG
jgi:DNA-binding transcriptional LysR family regulator